jgi:Zinc dependent phospholipase C
MPGPFTHIYTQRRLVDMLSTAAAEGGVNDSFVREVDGPLFRPLDPGMLGGLSPSTAAQAMQNWPKFAALGAVGPDLFFFLQDYAQPQIPSDELMLAMSLLYWLDDQNRLPDPWDGLLAIIEDITGSTFVALLRFLIKLNKLWQDFIDKLQDLIGPILDAAGQLLDDVTGGLLHELGDLFTQLKNDLMTLIAEEALSWQDVFAFFSLKMRSGVDEQAFVWSDMVHYRLTSYVPRRLLDHAKSLGASADPRDQEHAQQLTAYALGWISHVGTDTVAHGYVNEQAGGPFRTHWQRHHLVENHMDAFNYQCTGDGKLAADDKVGWIDGYEGLNHSALYFAVQIPQDIDSLPNGEKEGDWRPTPLPEGDTRVHRKEREEKLDTDGALPMWLAEVIVRVLVEVYATPDEGGLSDQEYLSERGPHPRNLLGMAFQNGLGDGAALLGRWLGVLGIGDPGEAFADLIEAVAPKPPAGLNVPEGFPLPWEVQVAYRFMLSWFKREFETGFDMDKPQRPTWFTPPPSDYDFGPPDFSGVNPSDDPLEQLCEVVLALLDWLWKSLEKAAQLAYDLGKSAISGATLPARQFLYDNLVLPAWQACENMRQVLVHMAYLTPQSEMRYETGEIRRPNEIDYELISLGHSVDGAFAAALAAAWDPLGNLDKDPSLTAPASRNPKGGHTRRYPWLPVRPTRGYEGQTTGAGSFPFYSDVVEFQRPWGFPDKTNDRDPGEAGNYIETPQTLPGPYPQDALPTVLFQTDGPASNRMRADYEGAGCPEQTDTYNEDFIGRAPFTNGYPMPEGTQAGLISGTNPLGDPIVFSAYLIGQIAGDREFRSNFNLDADRGFAYLCWDWIRDPKATAFNKRGQPYAKPVTPPEGTVGEWEYPDPVPAGQDPPPLYQNIPGHDKRTLKLEYPGRSCEEVPPIG